MYVWAFPIGTLGPDIYKYNFFLEINNLQNNKYEVERITTLLKQYAGSLQQVNEVILTGALTTVTQDGSPRVGVSSKTGNKYINGIKFIADGRNNKQASETCVAYGDELVTEIEDFLKANHTPEQPRPFGRLMIRAKLQSNNFVDKATGKTNYKNELNILDIWLAPTKVDNAFEYSSEEE